MIYFQNQELVRSFYRTVFAVSFRSVCCTFAIVTQMLRVQMGNESGFNLRNFDLRHVLNLY